MPKKKTTKKEQVKTQPITFEETLEVDTDDKRRAAIALLFDGMNTPFWHFIHQVLKKSIKELEETILNDNSIDYETTRDFKRRLFYLKQLIDLPDRLISDYTANLKVEIKKPIADPYEGGTI